jgi:hypothetical protein
MWGGDALHAREALDEAVARSLARRTAWVRQFARAGRGAPRPEDLRVEGAVDLRRRIAVLAEACGPTAPVRGFETARSLPAARLLEPFAERRSVVYAGGARYVATRGGWEREAGDIEGPRQPSDPVWLLDALRYAADCAARGGQLVCALDLSRADAVDCSGFVPASRWRRRRPDWLAQVPCVVTIGDGGAITRMSYVGRRPSDGTALQWATTEFVEYGVPVEIPDLIARVPAPA